MATIGSLSLNIGAESASLLREIEKSNRAVNNFARQVERQNAIVARGRLAAPRGFARFRGAPTPLGIRGPASPLA